MKREETLSILKDCEDSAVGTPFAEVYRTGSEAIKFRDPSKLSKFTWKYCSSCSPDSEVDCLKCWEEWAK